jgi:hypothetical protein
LIAFLIVIAIVLLTQRGAIGLRDANAIELPEHKRRDNTWKAWRQ